MRLPRRFARLTLLLTGAGVLSIAVGMLIGGSAIAVGVGVFLLLYLTASGIQMRFLRCPHCGKAVLPAKWSKKAPILCPKCKRQVLWDF